MIESYRSGYMKCLVDLVNVCNTNAVLSLKSGKKMRRFIESLMGTLVSNPIVFDEWIECGGNPRYMESKLCVSPEGEVKLV